MVLSKLIKGAANFFAGGVIKFAKKPSIKTLPGAAFDVVTTIAPIGKVGKVAKVGKIAVRALPKLGKASIKVAKPVAKGTARSIKSFVPKTTRGKVAAAVAAPVAIGALQSSPTLRSSTTSIINPLENIKRGRQIGQSLEKSPSKSDISDVLTKGAVLGGGAAAAAAAVVVGKKALDKARSSKNLEVTNPNPIIAAPAPSVVEKSIPTQQPDMKPLTPAVVESQAPTSTPPGLVNPPGQVKTAKKRKTRRKKVQPISIKNTVRLKNINNIAIAR